MDGWGRGGGTSVMNGLAAYVICLTCLVIIVHTPDPDDRTLTEHWLVVEYQLQ